MSVVSPRRAFAACALLVASLAAGCAHGESALPPTSKASSGLDRVTARFVIAVPARSAANAAQRRPAYVSPATESLTLAITGATTLTQTANLTPTSNGCSSTLATTVCTLAVALAPGTYTAAISTYDGTNGTGTLLSSGQNVGFTIVQGQANTIPLTLNGVPHTLQVAAQSAGAQPTGASSFTITGVFPVSLEAIALDADGNIIVGPGAPTYTVAQTSGTAYATANPSASSPNTFTLTPPAVNGAAATFTVTAAYGDATCSQTGAVCTTSFGAVTHLQYAIVENAANVTVYAPPYTGAGTALSGYLGTAQLPGIAAFDSAGNLFISDSGGEDVKEYAPPYTGTPIASIGDGLVNNPIGVAVGPGGTLFVASFDTNAVYAYAPPYTGTPTTISNGMNGPSSIALDSAGDLFVANFNGNDITEYAPPYTGAPAATSGPSQPLQVVANSAGDAFALAVNGSQAYEFAPPYTGAGTSLTADMSGAAAIGVGPGDALFVGQSGRNRVDLYEPPYTAVTTMISNGVNEPQSVAFDAAQDLFVANYDANNVTIYAPPYTGTPTRITNGVSSPEGVFVSP